MQIPCTLFHYHPSLAFERNLFVFLPWFTNLCNLDTTACRSFFSRHQPLRFMGVFMDFCFIHVRNKLTSCAYLEFFLTVQIPSSDSNSHKDHLLPLHRPLTLSYSPPSIAQVQSRNSHIPEFYTFRATSSARQKNGERECHAAFPTPQQTGQLCIMSTSSVTPSQSTHVQTSASVPPPPSTLSTRSIAQRNRRERESTIQSYTWQLSIEPASPPVLPIPPSLPRLPPPPSFTQNDIEMADQQPSTVSKRSLGQLRHHERERALQSYNLQVSIDPTLSSQPSLSTRVHAQRRCRNRERAARVHHKQVCQISFLMLNCNWFSGTINDHSRHQLPLWVKAVFHHPFLLLDIVISNPLIPFFSERWI